LDASGVEERKRGGRGRRRDRGKPKKRKKAASFEEKDAVTSTRDWGKKRTPFIRTGKGGKKGMIADG